MGLVLEGAAPGEADAVAIKVVAEGLRGDPRAAERLRREAATLERVRHPNVVGLLAHGAAGGCDYLVMEWVEGPTLARVIADAGAEGAARDFPAMLPLFESIAKGVAAIHAVGLVHRDLKPSNILIGPGGVPRIADFGIASRTDAGRGPCTTTGNAPGTYEYMAPEQLADLETADGRADLYALGVTFYEYLTGTRPVGTWRPASTVNPTVPAWFDVLLGRLLEADRERRMGDTYELISALSHGRAPVPGVATLARRPWTPWLIGIGLPIFGPFWAGVLAALNWWRLSRPRESWRPIALAAAAAGLSALAPALAPAADERPAAFVVQILMLVTLAFTDLRPQWRQYRAYRKDGGPPGRWRIPIVAGVALTFALQAWYWDGDGAAAAYRRGVALGEIGQLDEAIAAYTRAIRHDPASADAYYARASAYLDKGDAERAASDLGQLIRLDPDNADAYSMRGGIFLAKGDLDLAIADCNEAIRRAPSEPAAYLKRGLAYLGKGRPAEALRDLGDYVRMRPDDGAGHYCKAQARAAAGDAAGAVADLDEAIRLVPADASYRLARAALLVERGQRDRARADLDEAIRFDPADARSLGLRAEVLIAGGGLDRALEDCNRLVELGPRDGEGYCLRARVHGLAGRLDEALADADRSVGLEPDSPRFLTYRGMIRQAKGDLGPAVADCSRAIELSPDYAQAHATRAECYAAMGDAAHADADRRAAERLDPSLAK